MYDSLRFIKKVLKGKVARPMPGERGVVGELCAGSLHAVAAVAGKFDYDVLEDGFLCCCHVFFEAKKYYTEGGKKVVKQGILRVCGGGLGSSAAEGMARIAKSVVLVSGGVMGVADEFVKFRRVFLPAERKKAGCCLLFCYPKKYQLPN